MKRMPDKGKRMFLCKVMLVCLGIPTISAMEKSNADSIAQTLTLLKAEQALLEGKLFLFGEGPVRPDYRKAYYLFSRALSSNNVAPEAYYWLGYMDYNGQGLEEDVVLSLRWFLKAADRIDAQTDPLLSVSIYYAIGLLYKLKKNYQKALDFFSLILRFEESEMVMRARQQLAAIKPPFEWYRDGEHYKMGIGEKKQDFVEARKCFEIVASVQCYEQAEAWYELGNLCHLLQPDASKAIEYYEKAANQERNQMAKAWASERLGIFFSNAQGMQRDYVKAKEYCEKAAAIEIERPVRVWALLQLGCLLHDVPEIQDYSKAKECFEKVVSSELDARASIRASLYLGELYRLGHGAKRHYGKAKECYERVERQIFNFKAKAGAFFGLGLIYAEGDEHIQKDYNKSIEYLEKTLNQEIDLNLRAVAWFVLGSLYADNESTVQGYGKAKENLEKAADQEINTGVKAHALAWLGILFKEGLGVQKDFDKAKEYFEKAVELGDELVKERAEYELTDLAKEKER